MVGSYCGGCLMYSPSRVCRLIVSHWMVTYSIVRLRGTAVVGGMGALVTTTVLDSVSFTDFTTIRIRSAPRNRRGINAVDTGTKAGLKSLRRRLTRGTSRVNTGSFHVASMANPGALRKATMVCGWTLALVGTYCY